MSGTFELWCGGWRTIFIESWCFVSAVQSVCFLRLWRCMALFPCSAHVWSQLHVWFQPELFVCKLLHFYRVGEQGLVGAHRDDRIGKPSLSPGLTIKPVGDRTAITSLSALPVSFACWLFYFSLVPSFMLECIYYIFLDTPPLLILYLLIFYLLLEDTVLLFLQWCISYICLFFLFGPFTHCFHLSAL